MGIYPLSAFDHLPPVKHDPAPPIPRRADGGQIDSDTLIQQALALVEKGEGRNRTGHQLGRWYAHNGYSEDEAVALGVAGYVSQVPSTNAAGEDDPYTVDEYTASVASAYGYYAQQMAEAATDQTPSSNGDLPQSSRELRALETAIIRRKEEAADNDQPEAEPDTAPDTPPMLRDNLTLVAASTITPRTVRWLWRGRIPLGKVTVIEGDPGIGKGTIGVDLAARVSTGAMMPDETASDLDGPASVIVISTAEDDADDTIVPRLIEAGACLDRVHLPMDDDDADATDMFTLSDAVVLERKIIDTGARYVEIDPFTAYLRANVRTNSDEGIRRVLRPLKGVAARTGAAIVVHRHLNKGDSTNPLYRGAGSIGIGGAARSVLLAARDPADPEQCILAVTKSNAAAIVPSLVYRIGRGKQWDVSRVTWHGPSAQTAQALLTPRPDGEEQSALGNAVHFLDAELTDGRQPTVEIVQKARDQGIMARTLERARERLGVIAERTGFGPGAVWYLRLPGTPAPSSTDTTDDTAEEAADRRWAESILASDWGEAVINANDCTRLVERGYGVTPDMSERAAAREVLDCLNGG